MPVEIEGRSPAVNRPQVFLNSVTPDYFRTMRIDLRRGRAFRDTDQEASPLAARPYDLRHAAVSLWLNAGVPAPTVARRAGHSVDVLLRVYAACIDGEDQFANTRIADALG